MYVLYINLFKMLSESINFAKDFKFKAVRFVAGKNIVVMQTDNEN